MPQWPTDSRIPVNQNNEHVLLFIDFEMVSNMLFLTYETTKHTLETKAAALESPVSCSRLEIFEPPIDVSAELKEDSRSITEVLCTGEREIGLKM